MRKFEQNFEKSEEEPKISYEFFYASHRTAKDFENLEKAFKKADIYAPEAMRWDEEALESLNNLSQGNVSIHDILQEYPSFQIGSARLKELKLIAGSKKPIMFVDLPEGHELLKTAEEADKLLFEVRPLFKKGEFKASIQRVREDVELSADFIPKREEVIKENLIKKTKELIKDSSKLKAKRDINVLIKLGPVHTGIYHNLKKEGLSVSRQFSSLPDVHLSLDEAERRIMLAKDKEVSDELLARGIVEILALADLLDVTEDSNKMVMVLRKLSSNLNLNDIEEISKELGHDSKKTIVDVLEERGIKIPKTEKEMDEMLGNNN